MTNFQDKLGDAAYRFRRQSLWRAANTCRRMGLKRSAVVIAENLDVLAHALERPNRQSDVPSVRTQPRVR